MAYNDLSLKERAQVIHMGVQAGLKSLKDIQSFYDNAVSLENNPDYDMEGYIRENPAALFEHEGHYPDTYKLPNHPTFSNESRYHSSITPGGHWSKEGFYEPSDYVLNRQGGWNNFLRGFYAQEKNTGAVPVFLGGVMLPEITATPQYKEGGSIHIKPSKKGTFTAAATKHGKSVQAFASQVLANKENYSPAMVKKANFARNASKWHEEGGLLAPIPLHRNSLDRKYDFIVDTWDSEYTIPRGYNEEQDLFFPYDSPEGGTQTVGPGLKLRKDGKGDAYSFSREEATKGVTRAQINEKLANHANLQYQKVLEFLNQNGNRLPYDTISPNIMRGLMDLRYQVGSLGGWNDLREAVLNGDLNSIEKESKVTYKTKNGQRKEDKRRNEHRAETFWHYSTGGPLYPFSFSKQEKPLVRY